MPTSENPGPAHDTSAIPWRCAGCRHDAAGLLMGMPCPECGRTLDGASVRPAWLEGGYLRRVRFAARLAITATVVLALFPVVVLGFRAQGFAASPMAISLVLLMVTAGATAAQTAAVLVLMWRTGASARRWLDVVAVVLRSGLLFVAFAGSFGFLSAQLQRAVTVAPLQGLLQNGAAFPGGTMQWVGVLMLQALIVLPAAAIDVLIARRAGAIARSISDDRPVWARLETAFGLIAWWLAGAGALCIVLPLTGWELSPMVWLVGHIALFRAIDRMAGLYAGESPRSGHVRAS